MEQSGSDSARFGGSPKAREDLVASAVREGGETYYVVKDPVTRRFFRFGEREYFIVKNLDGRSSLGEIAARHQIEFGRPIPEEKLEQFVDRLSMLCLLDERLSAREIVRLQRKASTEAGPLHSLLQLKLKAVDPDRFLAAALPYTRFFFTRWFGVLAAALTVAAIAVTMREWPAYTEQARTLFRPGAIPTFVLVVIGVTALHELAHGLTCKHYGGEVREIGFLLIYLVPALYCNVSDAWLLKDKRKRIWVSAAGTYFQVLIYAVAALVWFFVDRQSWLSGACAMTIPVAGLTALFNFNPLIKLDGYYMLSDYLEIPNLRKRAFAYLWERVRRVLRMGPPGETPPDVSRRERAIYLLYGISAAAYSAALLAVIVFKIGSFVVSTIRAR